MKRIKKMVEREEFKRWYRTMDGTLQMKNLLNEKKKEECGKKAEQ